MEFVVDRSSAMRRREAMRTLTARNWLAVWRASWRYHAVSGLLACAACAAHAGPNLVVNGGFETGNFAGWLVSDSSLTVARSEMPHSGSFEADLGNRSLSTLQQTISTIAGTP